MLVNYLNALLSEECTTSSDAMMEFLEFAKFWRSDEFGDDYPRSSVLEVTPKEPCTGTCSEEGHTDVYIVTPSADVARPCRATCLSNWVSHPPRQTARPTMSLSVTCPGVLPLIEPHH